MIDVERARAVTPGCTERIHLNNAGAALMTEGVLRAQVEHLELEAQIGGYEAADQERDRIEGVYSSIATMLGTTAEHIAIVDNATTAWMAAFHSVPLGPGDRVLTAEAEYGANFVAFLQAARRRGVEIVVVPSDETGALDLDALARELDRGAGLVAVSHVPTNGGLVNPAAEIGALAAEHGVLYLLDACQSVGQLALDVADLRCDFLSATGRKYLRAPRGSGFLYVSDRVLAEIEPAILDHHGAEWAAPDRYVVRDDARRFENWEFNYAAVLGLGAAVDEALAWGLPAIEARVTELGDGLRDRLTAAGLDVYDLGTRRCGIVTTVVPDVPAAAVKAALAERGVNVSVSIPDSTWIDFDRRQLPDLVRLSPHYYNTDEELDAAVDALTATVRLAG